MFKLKTFFQFTFSSIIICLILSCDKTTQTGKNSLQEISFAEFKVNSKDIIQIKYTEFALSNLSEKTSKDWLKFIELQEEIAILKKGDLAFFKDDKIVLKSFITDLKNEIPEAVNVPSILVRLSVLETAIFKLEGVANLHNVSKDVLLRAIKDVLVANSNVILQINKKFEKESQNIQKPE